MIDNKNRIFFIGILLGTVTGIFGSLISGSVLLIIQLQKAPNSIIATDVFLIFLNSLLGLMLFIKSLKTFM